MKIKKKIFSFLLFFLFGLSLSSCSITSPFYVKGLVFKLSSDSKSFEVVDYNGKDTNVVIPSRFKFLPVTSIGDGAFRGCSSLTNITIPSSVTSIGDGLFFECSSLTSITIPNSVTSIGGGLFYECNSLTSITIPNSVTSIGGGAFSRCRSLTSITIPNSVTSIGDYAFYGCSSLTSITIPNSVTSIGDSAFLECSSLTTVYYTGSQEQWDSIHIDDYNDCLKNATIVYNYNG